MGTNLRRLALRLVWRNCALSVSWAELAVARYRRTFGADNPVTLAAEVNYAIVRRALGDPRASGIGRTVLSTLQATVGVAKCR
ncbi:hypothetical protein GCM10010168_09950 [Actinoplanes ianthinogenes]|uniref:Uncharacterized protein n=1 Tax=Actinoplanes ianthinogenes TaxID=122358 RepID=A0ABN6CF89_9ACTN|nr:hypothetical protein Aiant_48390 [Actinoplanes ianthinogenes]GGQ96300.1 hypothetical protein GCM10010168_09950 [Actinoplanes ianthinogenes]